MLPTKCNEKKRKLQEQPVSSESVKMLQYRASPEEKLKRKTDIEEVDEDGGDDDFYDSVKRQRELKLRMKAQKFSRNLQDISEAYTTVDGKRYISASMEKNRGLTRNRKKQNPKKVNRMKYEKAKKRRQGQRREHRKPTGPYGGERTGINTRVTSSIKLQG